MANTFVVSRSHLIYGVCLPLAVLIGYLLAEPADSGTMAVLILVLSVLSVPFVMRWHHPLLIFSCNAWIAFYFLPGHPPLWMIMAFISLGLSVLNRSLGHHLDFFLARGVSYSLLCLGLVAFVTALLTGGVGVRFLGGASYGGKKYIYFFASIMLYFALATRPIPHNRAKLYVGLFFLSALLPLVVYVAAYLGPGFYFLSELFPMQLEVENIQALSSGTPNFVSQEITRLGDLATVAKGVLCYVMARAGARGLMDLRRPWRMGFFLLAMVGSLYSGFRSSLLVFPLTFAVMFCLEGLYRTRYLISVLVAVGLGAVILFPNVNRLPPSMQRALSIVPLLNVDAAAREDASGSTDWRVQMWKQLLPEIPKYLIKGKGYSINPEELYLVSEAASRGTASPYEVAIVAGDYHSGPLSVIIPLGLGGVIAFLWFLGASLQVLYSNYRYGDPELYYLNAFLLAYFIVQTLVFFFIFGSLFGDLVIFTGMVGLSVGLNGGARKPPEPDAVPIEEEEVE